MNPTTDSVNTTTNLPPCPPLTLARSMPRPLWKGWPMYSLPIDYTTSFLIFIFVLIFVLKNLLGSVEASQFTDRRVCLWLLVGGGVGVQMCFPRQPQSLNRSLMTHTYTRRIYNASIKQINILFVNTIGACVCVPCGSSNGSSNNANRSLQR